MIIGFILTEEKKKDCRKPGVKSNQEKLLKISFTVYVIAFQHLDNNTDFSHRVWSENKQFPAFKLNYILYFKIYTNI